MAAQATNNSPPSLVTDGVPVYPTKRLSSDDGACYMGLSARESTLMIGSTAGSGTMVGTFYLWGYLVASGKWYRIAVNGGSALAETTADNIAYQERFLNLGHYDRLYLELASVGGSATAFEAWLATSPAGCD